ncbi:DUF2268 domain-containing putative Zn-dependent protease [Hymenobacter sediminicola]|uniref:DUF2268 domain-containing protein n=1 Tax=Hymenobacter sediminicola TaxID=2761579 RepID=A0A7G7WAA1_9BACT|nr:DUF2268 domain-containing putative Zn-dependent protease [Hymenobacter sediminicola]QNH63294.1 hypothetical protein H4317_05675 [Hymenobacter sediminicola]
MVTSRLYPLLLALLLCGPRTWAQNTTPATKKAPIQPVPTIPAREAAPLKVRFETQDVTNFWRAFDADAAGMPGNLFATLYWQPATPGTRILLEKNGLANADSLRAVVRRRRADYLRIRASSERMASAVPACRATYLALKNLYPAATFPPVIFGIGIFGVGGNAQAVGLLLSAEMNAPADMPALAAHEAVHLQQNIPYKYRILLEQCLIEGGADFVAELASGRIVKTEPYEYAVGREKQLWQEFARDQNLGENDSFANWLYGGDRPAGRPSDLGYYIGYQICKAYYSRATDKRQAVHDILNIADCRQFLQQSHYAGQFR